MLQSQRLQVRSSEIRTRLNELANADAPTAEQLAEVDKLRGELATTETQYRAAVAAEDSAEHRANADDSPERRESEQLRQRASLGSFIEARLRGRLVDGAEEEYRAACGVSEGAIPLGMFEPRERAVTGAPNAGTPVNVGPIVPYVFASSLAPSLGIEVRTAAPGSFNIPRITTAPGGGAGPVAAGAGTDETAGVMDIVSSTPRRLPVAVRTNLESIWTLGPEYEDALRESVRMQLSDKFDDQLINGAAAAPALNGLLTQLTAPTAAGALLNWQAVGDAFVDAIDGLWARELSEVSAVVGVGGYQYASKLFQQPVESGSGGHTAATPGSVSAAEYVGQRSAGFRAHTRMPAVVDDSNEALDHNITVLFARRGMPDVTRAIVPTWGELSIDDPYTAAANGQRVYTFVMGVGALILVHPAAYTLDAWQITS